MIVAMKPSMPSRSAAALNRPIRRLRRSTGLSNVVRRCRYASACGEAGMEDLPLPDALDWRDAAACFIDKKPATRAKGESGNCIAPQVAVPPPVGNYIFV